MWVIVSNFVAFLENLNFMYALKFETDQMAVLIFETKQWKVSKMFVLRKYTAKFSIVNLTIRVRFEKTKQKNIAQIDEFYNRI